MMAGWIKSRREGPFLRAWIWYRGELYLTAVLLPPFVAACPEAFAGSIASAKDKAARELAAMFGRVNNVAATFTPLVENKNA